MKFNLVKKSSNPAVAKFHVMNSDGDVVGSINVSPSEEADLLKWVGERPKAQMSAAMPKQKSRNAMISAMLALKPKGMSQAALLRSC